MIIFPSPQIKNKQNKTVTNTFFLILKPNNIHDCINEKKIVGSMWKILLCKETRISTVAQKYFNALPFFPMICTLHYPEIVNILV